MTNGMIFLEAAEYQPRVAELYGRLRRRILQAVPQADVEHIGSSAVRGALSKGDLDILVRVKKSDFASALAAIETLGFSVKEGTFRAEWLCMLEGPDDSAIQLIEAGSEGEMFSRFRDLLNSDRALVAEYNLLKSTSFGLRPDEYRARKSLFIESVLVERGLGHLAQG